MLQFLQWVAGRTGAILGNEWVRSGPLGALETVEAEDIHCAAVDSDPERQASDCRICPNPGDLADEIEIADCRLQREVEASFQRCAIECKWQIERALKHADVPWK